MEIDVFSTINSATDDGLAGKVVLVVDTLRATTTIATALEAGCLEIIPVLTPEEAIEMRERLEDDRVLLGGERGGVKIPGFDLGNSPLEYTAEVVGGKRIIMTTTNGTRAIKRAAPARVIFLAAVVNAPAVAAAAAEVEGDVSILCAGTRDRFSLEDFLTAGLLIDELRQRGNYSLRDGARAALELYGLYKGDVAGIIRGSLHGRQLLELGFEADLDYSSRIGLLSTVPSYNGGLIKTYR
ncbi:MAG: 2-phosphosulfolactate phosphatase [Thermoanaerobacteraceae bacterium]|uniref:2-phosphosulfolactate phosphatase n=1 Tax=Thermanaeromonas sp. C210 TaxID=2731925 RepID=UPI00155C037C|nr:2-phosphosulfolactate phosphatase [Thermanaeromonas sp. C210]MBE3580247.1 2-phosphosulfolactate phosphatase [Thermoanaerobacteraceae bacterium]GFN22919.1 putative 2-phosphosulfolactate phosphatase [Thermanaeromonas sp. C210]